MILCTSCDTTCRSEVIVITISAKIGHFNDIILPQVVRDTIIVPFLTFDSIFDVGLLGHWGTIDLCVVHIIVIFVIVKVELLRVFVTSTTA